MNRMNFYALTRWVFLFVLYMVVSKVSTAQSNNVPVAQTTFQHLDLEHQRILIHEWMNQSNAIVLPAEFEAQAKEFYHQQGLSESIYKKYSSVFQAIFNPSIHTVNRINYCNFLLQTFQEDELPLQLIRIQKQQLVDLSTK